MNLKAANKYQKTLYTKLQENSIALTDIMQVTQFIEM